MLPQAILLFETYVVSQRLQFN